MTCVFSIHLKKMPDKKWLIGLLAVGTTVYVAWHKLRRPSPPSPIDPSSEQPTPRPQVHIFFGSQTGTGETFARELAEEAKIEFGLEFEQPTSLETVDCESFFSCERGGDLHVVLILSTYGEGDASDDASAFDSWLGELQLADQPLRHVRYSIFGLGNKQYALFNEMAKRTDKRLSALGAQRTGPTGFGDDNADIEQDFNSWKSQYFFPSIIPAIGLEYDTARLHAVVRNPLDKCSLELSVAEKRSKLKFDATVQSVGNDLLSKFFFASNLVPVVAINHLCTGKVHLDLDISKVPSLRYRSGDTVDLLPLNPAAAVEWLLTAYGVDGNQFMTFTKKNSLSAKLTVKKPFPTPCTLRHAVQRFVDLHSSPSRVFIRDVAILSGMSADDAEKFADSVKTRTGVWTTLRLLQDDFPLIATFVSLGDLLQLLPKQKSRAYSICSSPLVDAKCMSIVVSRVDDDALASTYICDRLDVNATVSVALRQGAFRLPTLPGTPVIMIAVGTGIAPFRGFMAELGIKQRCASATVFFGCRTEDEWIYRDEMEAFKAQGGTLHVALSRAVPNKRVYVQDLLANEKESIKNLVVNKKAMVYVCGSTQMGLEVMKVFERHIGDVADLRTQKRYFEELWG